MNDAKLQILNLGWNGLREPAFNERNAVLSDSGLDQIQ